MLLFAKKKIPQKQVEISATYAISKKEKKKQKKNKTEP